MIIERVSNTMFDVGSRAIHYYFARFDDDAFKMIAS